MKSRNASNDFRLSEQIKLFEVKKKKKKMFLETFCHCNCYISKASGSKEKQSSWTIFKHIRDSKGESMNILCCDHLAKGLCGFVEYVWMDCQRWVNKYEQTARNIVWMQKINAFRPGARISLLPLWQTIYPTMIIPQRRAITLPVHSIASVS